MFGLVSYDGSRKTTRKIIPLETKLIFHGTLFFTSVKLWEEECSNVFQIGGSTMNYVYEYLGIHNNTWYIYKLIICGYFMAISLLTNGLVLVMFFILLVPLSRHVRDLFSGWGRRPEILRRWVVWGRRPKKTPKTPKPRRKSPPHVGSKIRQFQYLVGTSSDWQEWQESPSLLTGGGFFVVCCLQLKGIYPKILATYFEGFRYFDLSPLWSRSGKNGLCMWTHILCDRRHWVFS